MRGLSPDPTANHISAASRSICGHKAAAALMASVAMIVAGCGGGGPGPTTFVNSREHLSNDLVQHYADFRLGYPSSFTAKPRGDKAENFIELSYRITKSHSYFDAETLSIGWFDSQDSGDTSKYFKAIVAEIKPSFESSPGYKFHHEGPTHVNAYEGYEYTFEIKYDSALLDSSKVYERIVLLSSIDGSNHGLGLLMLGDERAPGIQGPEDLGVKGKMPEILKTLQMGKAATASPPAG